MVIAPRAILNIQTRTLAAHVHVALLVQCVGCEFTIPPCAPKYSAAPRDSLDAILTLAISFCALQNVSRISLQNLIQIVFQCSLSSKLCVVCYYIIYYILFQKNLQIRKCEFDKLGILTFSPFSMFCIAQNPASFYSPNSTNPYPRVVFAFDCPLALDLKDEVSFCLYPISLPLTVANAFSPSIPPFCQWPSDICYS